jgi:hypothetical protein
MLWLITKMAVNFFITLATDGNVIKLFTAVSYNFFYNLERLYLAGWKGLLGTSALAY